MGDRSKISLRDFSLLPDDVIHLIVSRVKAVEDLTAMSSVCSSWRLVTVKDHLTRRVQFPWLMMSPRYIFENKGFFSIDRTKHFNIMVPYLNHSRCWGSKFGWLIVLCFNRQFHLFNPVTRLRLDLPPKPIFKDEIDHDDRDNAANSMPGFIRKAVVFKDGVGSSANEDKYIVVALGTVSGNLAFARPGEKHWSHVKSPFGRVMSAVWCNDKLFFLLGSGALMRVEDKGMRVEEYGHNRYEAHQFVPEKENIGIWDNIGLVDFLGDLFMVIRYYGELKNWHKTSTFTIFKLDFEKKEWVGTKDLGDCALFIDADDNIIALKASEVDNCKSNCIYFVEKLWDTHGRYFGSCDVGVYNLNAGSIDPYFIRDPNTSSLLQQNPVWVMPSLC